MTVEMITEILENELKNAVEVKDEKSLHRYVSLLSENIVSKHEHKTEYYELKSDLKEMLVFLRERFDSIDKRFEAVDKRFEAVDKRFTSLQWFLGMGFIVLSVLITLMQYLN